MKYESITEKIIGCGMKVHNYFGPGFHEIIYQRSLLIELKRMDLNVDAEVEKTVFYNGIPVGKRRIDLIVENKILVELKAISQIENDSRNQVLNCLEVFGYEVALLLNFGKASLEYKRFISDSYKK
ncbi:MAG: GxxExxY protein [Chitinophagaceae bacterium]